MEEENQRDGRSKNNEKLIIDRFFNRALSQICTSFTDTCFVLRYFDLIIIVWQQIFRIIDVRLGEVE